MSKKSKIVSKEHPHGRRIRVGITIPNHANDEQAIWGNGMFQNAVFLYRSLQHLENVKPFVLGSHALAKKMELEWAGQITGYCDVVIEVCGQLSPNAAAAHHVKGGKLVLYVAGNQMMANLESLTGQSSGADIPNRAYDAIWLQPHIATTNLSYFAAAYRCAIDMCPVVWEPSFITRQAPQGWGYAPGRTFKKVGVFEPSVSVVKTPHIPLLIAEKCNRLEPEQGPAISELHLYAAYHLADDPVFMSMLDKCTAIKDQTTLRPRVPAWAALQDVDCVVSHTFENGLNYNWYEALYGGWPLLHNSQHVKAGYPYMDFNVHEGANLLWNVLKKHDDPEVMSLYREAARTWLSTLHPQNVYQEYGRLVQNLFTKRVLQ